MDNKFRFSLPSIFEWDQYRYIKLVWKPVIYLYHLGVIITWGSHKPKLNNKQTKSQYTLQERSPHQKQRKTKKLLYRGIKQEGGLNRRSSQTLRPTGKKPAV
jgi:hypothetical protein